MRRFVSFKAQQQKNKFHSLILKMLFKNSGRIFLLNIIILIVTINCVINFFSYLNVSQFYKNTRKIRENLTRQKQNKPIKDIKDTYHWSIHFLLKSTTATIVSTTPFQDGYGSAKNVSQKDKSNINSSESNVLLKNVESKYALLNDQVKELEEKLDYLHRNLDNKTNKTTETIISEKRYDNVNVSDSKNKLGANSSKLDVWFRKMEAKYTKLNEHVKEVCKRYNLNNPSEARYRLDIELMIDTTHHLAYCRNAKVGSTTWMHHFNDLLPLDQRPWDDGTGNLNYSTRARINNAFKPSSLFQSERENPGKFFTKLFKDEKYEVFTFVRHPFERLVSAYTNKINSEKVSFSSFADRVIDRFIRVKLYRVNKHWRLFSSRCQHCYIPYTLIGRMETFDEDVQYIILKNKLEKQLPITKTLQFKSKNSSLRGNKENRNITMQHFSQLEKQQIEKLYELYKLDFEMFEYDIDAFLHMQK